MFKNYFKIAFRNIVRNKTYSFINIFGLAIGIATFMLITMWVNDEKSYDQFNRDGKRIYRVEKRWDFREMRGQGPITSAPFGPNLLNDYPEIENAARLQKTELPVKDFRNTYRKKKMLIADPSIFAVLKYKLEAGDEKTALQEPNSVVLTKENALKYLNTEDAIGQSITMEWNNKPVDFIVTGLLEKTPKNSHITFDMVISLSSYPSEKLTTWFDNPCYTYIQLKENTSPENLESKFPDFQSKYMTANFAAFFGPDEDINKVFQIKLRPLLSIHLIPSRAFEIEPQGSEDTVFIFSIIAIMILMIACINFMNLSTARGNKRAKEVGMRKTIGASKHQLWFQFLGESFLNAFFALIIALFLIEISLPVFNQISGKTFSALLPFTGINIFMLISIGLTTGFLSGIYPAFYLASFKPITVLKNTISSGNRKSLFRTVTAIFQFVISIGLIIATFVIYTQLNYIQNKTLGLDKENVMVISAGSGNAGKKMETFKNVLLKDPHIKSVSASSNDIGNPIYFDTNFKRSDNEGIYNILLLATDYDYINTYDIELLHGRFFSKDFTTDKTNALVLNKKAVETIGYSPEEVIGKELLMTVGADSTRRSTIIGVLDDFHFQSLKMRIQPLAMFIANPNEVSYIAVKAAPGNLTETVGFVEDSWNTVFSGKEFNFNFLDSRLNTLYVSEKVMQKIFLVFSFLSIFIACLGLLALAAFRAEEKTKEIGIRKVMGASVSNIVIKLSGEFTKWMLIANIIAWPLAYYLMNKWLQNFAYKTEMNFWIFIISGTIALSIALITISTQAVKAAIANPVKALKYE